MRGPVLYALLALGCRDAPGPAAPPADVDSGGPPAVRCDSLHAYLIMRDQALPDCDTPLEEVTSPWAGLGVDACVGFVKTCVCEGRTANDCAGTHYADPPLAPPAEEPRPNTQTAHFLPDTPAVARCAIGSRPLFYFTPGKGDGASRWAFYLQGSSGGYSPQLDRVTGLVASLGEVVAATAIDEELGSAQSGFGYPVEKREGGLFSDDPRSPFLDWNRVELVKCHGDQYTGQQVHRDVTIRHELAPTVVVDQVWTVGHRYVQQVLGHLASPAWEGPSLSGAREVLRMCRSAGAHGLIQTADALVPRIGEHAPGARVGVVLDGRPDPAVEAFEMFDAQPCDSVYEASCEGIDAAPLRGVTDYGSVGFTVPFGFDRSAFAAPDDPLCAGQPYACGVQRLKWEAWQAQLDESCLASQSEDPAPCYDPSHVLLNHLAAPAFVSVATRDRRLMQSITALPAAADQPATCFAAWVDGAEAYELTVGAWLSSYVADRAALAAGDARTAEAPGVWATRAIRHTHLVDDCALFGRRLVAGVASHSLATAILAWWEGADMSLVEGANASLGPSTEGMCENNRDYDRAIPPECDQPEWCGDGVVNQHEACDDGNSDDADACTNRCTQP